MFIPIAPIMFALLSMLALAHSHSWYEPECCGDDDCHRVPCEELGRDAYDNVTFDGYTFRGTQIRPSKDAQCHVCFHDYYGGIMRRPICVYILNGT